MQPISTSPVTDKPAADLSAIRRRTKALTDAAPRGRKQPLHLLHVREALLSLSTVGEVIGISTATVYRRAAADPTFPRLIRLGNRTTRVRAGDLVAWLNAQGRA